MTYDYLLLGGGTSCAYAAVKIRERDKDGTVAILGAENEPPYDRPPFSKYYLWDDAKNIDDFHSKDETFYPQNNVELLLGKCATEIDRTAKKVRCGDGSEYGYKKLLYALGSEPRHLPIPGGESAWVLRSAEDSKRIRNAATKGAKAVLIGGGYIGAELASSLAGRGCEVTLIEAGDKAWARFPSSAASSAVTKELKRKGVNLLTGQKVNAIENGNTVKTDDGSYTGDFVVAGVGASPRIELAAEAGLTPGKSGVLADSRLRTSDQSIWASGDVVEYHDLRIDAPYRIEHHLHAKGSAEHCGMSMAGEDGDYKGLPWFFSDVGDLSMNLRGYPERAARSVLVNDTDEPVVTEVFLFGDGTVAGVVDLRQDYKAQDPIMEKFGELILARAGVDAVPAALGELGIPIPATAF
ncbi:MAG TPA: NAD(P)/FAD-dependent oxidoreductase [Fimbriimonadaceae bacterium]|nr:NAD(P)/FAD-dependent oxidoreductase [Fimbriimonadaceae bacterium]